VSGVDASLRLAILDLMRKLNQERGIAFLYITHDLATARYFGRGGRLVVMYLGAMVEVGEVGAVLDRPRHPYLKALLAALPPLDPRQARQRVELPLKSLDMPDPTRPPTGCAFHPRCLSALPVCSQERPLLLPAADDAGVHVACHVVPHG
jgi:peptide/nickel transport system ATP-binding protein